MIALKKIVVATDFDQAADAALAYGRDLARTFGAELVLLHVVNNLLVQVAASGGYAMDLDKAQSEIESAAQDEINARLTDEDRRHLKAQSVVLVDASPARAILDYAHDKHADLIVLGTHGRGAIGHLFMGSVAERVVRAAPCPVLTVRHPEHEFVLPDALVARARA